MSKITLSLFILLLLTSCATSKFDFATAYKFNTVKRYPTLGEKSLKVLASPEEVLPNHLLVSESKIIETASLKSIAVTSEDIIHSKLSTYEKLDNMSRKDTRHNNKLNKIITRLSDIKFDTIITESGLVVPLIEKEIQEEAKKSYYTLAGALAFLFGILTLISFGWGALFLIISPILAAVGYIKYERGAIVLLTINLVLFSLVLIAFLYFSLLYG